nr:MAG TPA: hypothetical protein [Caudoviricetes sp.]
MYLFLLMHLKLYKKRKHWRFVMGNSNYYVTTKVSWYDNEIKYEYDLIKHTLTVYGTIKCTYSVIKMIIKIINNMNHPETIDHEVIDDLIKHYRLKHENEINENVEISFSLFDKNHNRIKFIKCVDQKEKIIINLKEQFCDKHKYYKSLKGFPDVYVEISHLDFIKSLEELTTQEYQKYGKIVNPLK